MNLKNLSSERLITVLKGLVAEERRVNVAILHHLKEVEARRLYRTYPDCPSLFEFARRVLKYSPDAAYRRIAAMRALKETPEIEEKLESGALTLTTVARASQFFREETASRKDAGAPALDAAAKREVFRALEGKSARAADEVLNARALVPVATKTVKVELSLSDYEKLQKLQSLFSHRKGAGSVSGVVSLLLDEGLERHDPARRAARVAARTAGRKAASPGDSLWAPKVNVTQDSEIPGAAPSARVRSASSSATALRADRGLAPARPPINGGPAGKRDFGALPHAGKDCFPSRYISSEVRRAVWLRDGGHCSAPGCSSTRWLELDHVTPFSLGGASTPENLRLLCSAHHQIATEDVFG